jgi:hypothetical protein
MRLDFETWVCEKTSRRETTPPYTILLSHMVMALTMSISMVPVSRGSRSGKRYDVQVLRGRAIKVSGGVACFACSHIVKLLLTNSPATINVSSLPPGVKLLPKAEGEPIRTTRLESPHLGHNPLAVGRPLVLRGSPESQTQPHFEAGSALVPFSSGSHSTATTQRVEFTQPSLSFGRLALENLPWHDFRQTLLSE